MVETTKLELSLNELKVLLTALYAFEQSIENKNTRRDTLLNIYAAEKFYNFDYELEALITDLPTFISKVIGLQCEKLSDAFYVLAEKTGTSKPLPPQDERFSFIELINFCDSDLKATSEGF